MRAVEIDPPRPNRKEEGMNIRRQVSSIVLLIVSVAVLGLLATPVSGEEASDWKSLKKEAKRAKIDETADEALTTLFEKSPKAKYLYDKSYGWAVFDNLKIAIGISGGGGNGVAVVKEGGRRTYMEMGTAGVGLGLGGKKYQVVFLFQDEMTFSGFVDKGWQADASASAVAGSEGAGGQSDFVNGMSVFMLTDEGLMAAVDIAGTKYWKNKKLND
jgi:lipid-binding SYLF domain-containing protein